MLPWGRGAVDLVTVLAHIMMELCERSESGSAASRLCNATLVTHSMQCLAYCYCFVGTVKLLCTLCLGQIRNVIVLRLFMAAG